MSEINAFAVHCVTAEQAQSIRDRFEIGEHPSLDEVLDMIWTWPNACVDGRLSAMSSIRESTHTAGSYWSIYMAWVEQHQGHKLEAVAEALGATAKNHCDWNPGSWVKLSPNDLSPELVVYNGTDNHRPTDGAVFTIYKPNHDGGSVTLVERNPAHFATAENCEPPAWFNR